MRANRPATQRLRIVGLGSEGSVVRLVHLERVGKEPVAAFGPGAHITTELPTDQGVLRRSYSLTGDPRATKTYSIAVARSTASDGGAAFWHRRARVGDVIEASLPRNQFSLAPKATHHIFLAGGIGITPFIPMLYQLRQQKRSAELHYMARTKQEAAFRSLLEREFGDQTTIYFTREGASDRFDAAGLKKAPIGSHLYLCGPRGMVDAYRLKAFEVGFPDTRVHRELFQAGQAGTGKAFTAHLAKSNKTIAVGEKETLLDAIEREGVEIPSSCRIGGCGSCLVEVLEGAPDHRDDYFSKGDRSDQQILPCVSRTSGDLLVLNI